MNAQEWLHLLAGQIAETRAIEWIGVAFGIGEVLLAKAGKIALYPAGIIGTALSIFLFFESRLYAECALSLYYIVMSFYGWYHWVKKKNEPPVKVSYANGREWLITAAISILGGIFTWFILKNYTNSNVPLADAFVSSIAWAGMWLLTRRKIENWLVLNISNFFAVPLLFYKHLPLYALLTIFLFVVAIFGHFDWVKEYKKSKQIEDEIINSIGVEA